MLRPLFRVRQELVRPERRAGKRPEAGAEAALQTVVI
jgi:hypothetical protein